MRPSIESWSQSDVIPMHPLYAGAEDRLKAEFANTPVDSIQPPASLIVGLKGLVPHPKAPGGFYPGTRDAASFEATDYEDVQAFQMALAGELALIFPKRLTPHGAGIKKRARTFNQAFPAQHAALAAEIWRRTQVKQRVYRTGKPVISITDKVPTMLRVTFTTDAGESAVIESLFYAQNPMQVSSVVDSLLQARWRDHADEAMKEVLADFLRETKLVDFAFAHRYVWGSDDLRPPAILSGAARSGAESLSGVMTEWLTDSPSFRRIKAGWRMGYRMNDLGDAIKAAYAEIDREAISFAAQLSSTLTRGLYVEILNNKQVCLDALRVHGGMAAAHLPTPTLLMLNGGRWTTKDKVEMTEPFLAGFRSGLSAKAVEFFKGIPARNLSVFLSRELEHTDVYEEQNTEMGRQAAEFLNLCADDGLVPSYTLMCFADLGKYIHGKHSEDGKVSGPSDAFVLAKSLSLMSGRGEKVMDLVKRLLSQPDVIIGERPDAVAKLLGRRTRPASVIEGRLVDSLSRRLGKLQTDVGTLTLRGLKPADPSDDPIPFISPNDRAPATLVFELRPNKGSESARQLITWPVHRELLDSDLGGNKGKLSPHYCDVPKGGSKAPLVLALAQGSKRNSSATEAIAPVVRRAIHDFAARHPFMATAGLGLRGEAMSRLLAKSRVRSATALLPSLRAAMASRSEDGIRAVFSAVSDPLHVTPRAKTLLDLVVDKGSPSQIKVAGEVLVERLGEIPHEYLQTATEAALDSHDEAKLLAVLKLGPRLTEAQADRLDAWHRDLRTREVQAEVSAGVMRAAVHAARGSAAESAAPTAGDTPQPTPVNRRRVGAL